jgi:hypothetical protein
VGRAYAQLMNSQGPSGSRRAGYCDAGSAAHKLRARWAVLVLLVAVAGGAVLTAAAGARRTASGRIADGEARHTPAA